MRLISPAAAVKFVRRLLTTKIYWIRLDHELYNYRFLYFGKTEFYGMDEKDIGVRRIGWETLRSFENFIRRWLTTRIYWVRRKYKNSHCYFLSFEQIPSFRTEDEKQQIREAAKAAVQGAYPPAACPPGRGEAGFKEEDDCEGKADAV
jgi:hypothetical protein